MTDISSYNTTGLKLFSKWDTSMNWFHLTTRASLREAKFKGSDLIEILNEWLIILGALHMSVGNEDKWKNSAL